LKKSITSNIKGKFSLKCSCLIYQARKIKSPMNWATTILYPHFVKGEQGRFMGFQG